jgi:hypothetical protein
MAHSYTMGSSRAYDTRDMGVTGGLDMLCSKIGWLIMMRYDIPR